MFVHSTLTELNSGSDRVYSNGSVCSARIDWAPTVLVSLQPIKSWRWRAWPMKAMCNWVGLLSVSVHFSSVRSPLSSVSIASFSPRLWLSPKLHLDLLWICCTTCCRLVVYLCNCCGFVVELVLEMSDVVNLLQTCSRRCSKLVLLYISCAFHLVDNHTKKFATGPQKSATDRMLQRIQQVLKLH